MLLISIRLAVLICKQALPLSPTVTKINPNGVAALAIDVAYLAKFVSSLGNVILEQNLDELQQTVSSTQNTIRLYALHNLHLRNLKRRKKSMTDSFHRFY